jgi:hypothetical protein
MKWDASSLHIDGSAVHDRFILEGNISGRSPPSTFTVKLIPLFMERFQEFSRVRYIKKYK